MNRLARLAAVTILGLTLALTAACGSTPVTATTSPCATAEYCVYFTHGMDDEHGFLTLRWAQERFDNQPWTGGTPTTFTLASGGTISVKGGGTGTWYVEFNGVATDKLTFTAADNSGGTATLDVTAGTLHITTLDTAGHPANDSFTVIGSTR